MKVYLFNKVENIAAYSQREVNQIGLPADNFVQEISYEFIRLKWTIMILLKVESVCYKVEYPPLRSHFKNNMHFPKLKVKFTAV